MAKLLDFDHYRTKRLKAEVKSWTNHPAPAIDQAKADADFDSGVKKIMEALKRVNARNAKKKVNS